MKKKLCLLLCAVLCLFPLGACQGEGPAEGALPQPPGLTVTCGEETIAQLPLVAGEAVPRITFGQMLLRMLRMALLSA